VSDALIERKVFVSRFDIVQCMRTFDYEDLDYLKTIANSNSDRFVFSFFVDL